MNDFSITPTPLAASSPHYCGQIFENILRQRVVFEKRQNLLIGVTQDFGDLLSEFSKSDREAVLGHVNNVREHPENDLFLISAVNHYRKSTNTRDLFVAILPHPARFRENRIRASHYSINSGIVMVPTTKLIEIQRSGIIPVGMQASTLFSSGTPSSHLLAATSGSLPTRIDVANWTIGFYHEVSHYGTMLDLSGWIERNYNRKKNGEAVDPLFTKHVFVDSTGNIVMDRVFFHAYSEGQAYGVSAAVAQNVWPRDLARGATDFFQRSAFSDLLHHFPSEEINAIGITQGNILDLAMEWGRIIRGNSLVP